MKMRFFSLTALVILSTTGLEAQSQLVVNGDFSDSLNGWTISSSGMGASWGSGVSGTANEAVFWGGLLSTWTLSQSINTTPGLQYEVSFSLRGGSRSYPGYIDPLGWSFGDFSSQLNFEDRLVYNQSEGYSSLPKQNYDFVVTATQPDSLLSFTEGEDTAWNLGLSDVSVTPISIMEVPEPSEVSLLALAMVGFVTWSIFNFRMGRERFVPRLAPVRRNVPDRARN